VVEEAIAASEGSLGRVTLVTLMRIPVPLRIEATASAR